MAGVYLDTSALGRVMLDEPDADAIGSALSTFSVVVSSRLLRIELHRLAGRRRLPAGEVESWLAGVALVPLGDAVLDAAERVVPRSVATLDAIHLVTALRLAEAGIITSMMTFDDRLGDAVREHGLAVLAPD